MPSIHSRKLRPPSLIEEKTFGDESKTRRIILKSNMQSLRRFTQDWNILI